jgi:pilus assembly protein TadC
MPAAKDKIPFAIIPLKPLSKISRIFYPFARKLAPQLLNLNRNLVEAEYTNKDPSDYLAKCLAADTIILGFFSLLSFFSTAFGASFFVGLSVSLFIIFFMFMQQLLYPKLVGAQRIKRIEIYLMPVLQSILIQLNSGVPLFNILVSIANEEYGEIAEEFKWAIKEINAGRPQVDVLNQMASRNPSIYFRRSLWQMTNSLTTGTDLSYVIERIIEALSEAQIIQIQKYGAQLKPLAMFYLMLAVILPTLGTTFVILLSSFIALSTFATKTIFWGILTFVVFFQLMFMGMIKAKRPSLLG